jgi:CHAD domain-containing protein
MLCDTLPGVLDGKEGSIHDARIATRRIRELLPLLADAKRRKALDDVYSRFKRLGRSLGRVRDADVRVTLLATLETRMPHAAPALVVLRQQREQ